MRKERQAILHLVAAGRLTAPQAERLLVISNQDNEFRWLAAAGLLAWLAYGHPWLTEASRLAHTLFPGPFPGLAAAATALLTHLGGKG